jgi:hypothetical protein
MRTLCRVEERNGKKRWVIIHNDFDPSTVGETTVYGMPCAAILSVGTEYESELRTPDAEPEECPSEKSELGQ